MSVEIVENFHAHSDVEDSAVDTAEIEYEAFQPIEDRVLILRSDKLVKTYGDSGLVRPDTFTQQSFDGTVIAVGEKVTSIRIGDWVRFGEYSVESIDVNGVDHVLVRIDDIRGFRRPKAS
jgi:co-chaperonin GroES (HSP10)